MIKSDKGFTLVELMVAVTLFGVFIAAFVVSQTNNVNTSIQIQSSLTLLRLCENKMNEVLVDPPKFTNLTDKEIKKDNFKTEGYKHFKYQIEYKKLELPNFEELTGSDEQNQGNDAIVKKTIFKKLKENLEKMVWQVKVTVTNTQNNESYELTSWLNNQKAEFDSNFGI